MPHPMRSTVGAAVLAGALVFSGTAANAQPVPADDSAATAQIEQAAPEADQSVPAPAPADAPSIPAVPAAPADETPGTDAPAGEPATDPAGAEADATSPATEELPAAEGSTGDETPADASTPVPAEIPAEVPAEVPAEAPASEVLPAGQPAPLTGTEAPAGQVAPPAAKPAAAEKSAAKEKAPAPPLPGAGTITFPEGSSEWTEKQWNEWMLSNEGGQWLEEQAEPLVEAMESEDFAGFVDSIIPFLIDGTPEELLAYLEATYPDDLYLAQFMVGVALAQLIEEGVLDEDGNFIGELVPGDEDPAEETDGGTDEPSEETDGETDIEPVANITKPKTPTTKPVEVFTPVKVPSGQLAETGAEGTILLAGAGAGMLLLGVGALALRRRKQA
ncbi:LPXTG cell wall anchor domain-containing protein [Paeniglutamicibacter sp. R2-26]|uniref:LPXTG cell wall anchor domain-containing protein n=1 Tax=Paeniglutamicibacter sp. R2-26 TaxID=3144417 RepID=UPI003EE69CF2